jgi:hypothetical protein
MGTKAKSTSARTRKQTTATGEGVRHVDPMTNRPPNADESSPETLIPDVVHDTLTSVEADSNPSERAARIARRAYELAAARGFAPGAELDDWLQAEREIDGQSVKQVPPGDQFTG